MEPYDFEYISHLYNYLSDPPQGTGSHTKAAATSIFRSSEYQRKNPDKRQPENYYNNVKLRLQGQHEGEPICTKDIQGFHHVTSCNSMASALSRKYSKQIKSSIIETVAEFHRENVSELGKGNQTLDPISWQTMGAAAALEKYCRFLHLNGYQTDYTTMTFMETILEMFDKEEILVEREEYKRVPKKQGKFKIYNKGRDYVWEKEVIKEKITGSQQVGEFMLKQCTVFESFVKHGERNHSSRRSIVSPTIPLRAFMRFIESLSKKICSKIDESTISIGGDEKKDKIQQMLNSTQNLATSYNYKVFITGDNSKWNECCSAELFMRIANHICYGIDDWGKIPDGEKYCRDLVYKMCKATFTFIFHKSVRLGIGKRSVDAEEKFFEYISPMELCQRWESLPDEDEKEIYRGIKDLMVSTSEAMAMFGMLMGMFNITSTEEGLSPMTYNAHGEYDPIYRDMYRKGKIKARSLRRDLIETGVKVPIHGLTTKNAEAFTEQSSDDFMTIILGISKEAVEDKIKELYYNCKISGINWSVEKTIIREINVGHGEYTSWFVRNYKLVPQWGSDTARFRPNGINAINDQSAMVRTVHDTQVTRQSNFFGSGMLLRLIPMHLRVTYRVTYGDTPMGLPTHLVSFVNGGDFKFNSDNTHLDETSMLLYLHMTWPSTEKDTEIYKNFDLYIRRLVNPECPLNAGVKTQNFFDSDTLSMQQKEDGVIFNSNNVQIRSNRKITNKKSDENQRRNTYGVVQRIATNIRPSLVTAPSSIRTSLGNLLSETLRAYNLQVSNIDNNSELFNQIRSDIEYLLNSIESRAEPTFV